MAMLSPREGSKVRYARGPAGAPHSNLDQLGPAAALVSSKRLGLEAELYRALLKAPCPSTAPIAVPAGACVTTLLPQGGPEQRGQGSRRPEGSGRAGGIPRRGCGRPGQASPPRAARCSGCCHSCGTRLAPRRRSGDVRCAQASARGSCRRGGACRGHLGATFTLCAPCTQAPAGHQQPWRGLHAPSACSPSRACSNSSSSNSGRGPGGWASEHGRAYCSQGNSSSCGGRRCNSYPHQHPPPSTTAAPPARTRCRAPLTPPSPAPSAAAHTGSCTRGTSAWWGAA